MWMKRCAWVAVLVGACAEPTTGVKVASRDMRPATTHDLATRDQFIGTPDLTPTDDASTDDGGGADASAIDAAPIDAAHLDAAHPDLASKDLVMSAPPDLVGSKPDLVGSKPDLVVLNDLAAAPRDLAVTPPDMTVLSDLIVPPDFVTPPDFMAIPPDMVSTCAYTTAICDPVCQNCPSGQKCDAPSSGNSGVCGAAGSGKDGASCSGNSDCAPGLGCFVLSSSKNACREYCHVDGDCKNKGVCAWGVSGAGSAFMVCSDPLYNCNPWTQSPSCPNSSDGCYIVTPDGRTGCHATGSGDQFNRHQGDSCVTDYDCIGGASCLTYNGNNYCAWNCDDVGSGSECSIISSSDKCTALTGWTSGYGFCP